MLSVLWSPSFELITSYHIWFWLNQGLILAILALFGGGSGLLGGCWVASCLPSRRSRTTRRWGRRTSSCSRSPSPACGGASATTTTTSPRRTSPTRTPTSRRTIINEQIDAAARAATTALLERRDVIIVASVSCIYGLGSPDEMAHLIAQGMAVAGASRRGPRRSSATTTLRASWSTIQYERNDIDCSSTSTTRHRSKSLLERGDVDRGPSRRTRSYDGMRIEFFGDEIERITSWRSTPATTTTSGEGARRRRGDLPGLEDAVDSDLPGDEVEAITTSAARLRTRPSPSYPRAIEMDKAIARRSSRSVCMS